MKKLIPFFLILIGCRDSNEVTITKEEYEKLTGNALKHGYPKSFNVFSESVYNYRIVPNSDGHEYIEINRGRRSYHILHYPECIKCKGIDTLEEVQ